MESSKREKKRILIAKVGLDGHERGAKVLSSILRDEGFEVIYLGLYNTPEMVVQAAIQEDVDVIGISFLSGEHLTLTPRIVKIMKEKGMDNVLLIVGGIIPKEDIPVLKEMGVDEVFSGSLVTEVAQYLKRVLEEKKIEGGSK
jgi:methylmalonyl-CoA mutase C-terminal domain/subunit